MISIEGTIEDIIFSNESNGYTVCEMKSEKDILTAVGFMPFINIGETLKITGKWVVHPDYGDQFKVELYEKVFPKTIDAIEKYLGSGLIKGIGPATAKKIVSKFGEDTMDILMYHPEKLSRIRGISTEKALHIGQTFVEQRYLRDVIMFFQQYGINPASSTKIYKALGEKTIEEVRENPYKLTDTNFGIGFDTVDKIAMNLGIDPYSIFRITSGIRYVLLKASVNGHTYLPEKSLLNSATNLLGVEIKSIDDALRVLLMDGDIRMEKEGEDGRVYLSGFYHAELEVCKKLLELSSLEVKDGLKDFEKRIKKIQDEEGIVLAQKQIIAVKEAMAHGILVISGGPGTGKTTIIKSIIKLLEREHLEFVLAAPTGRAAKRMSEATGYEAKTIHRLLEIGFSGNDDERAFQKAEVYSVEADVVIIDEVSMVDIILMNQLLKSLVPGTRLILVGDMDQLPSVGAGNVLKDIITSNIIKTVKLSEIFRQAQESMIIVNAHRINAGEQPYLNVKNKDFFLVKRNGGDRLVNAITELCSKRLPDTYNYDPLKHIQVLTPTRKGIAGVWNLNKELQSVLNPKSGDKNERAYRDFIFREGDRVMQVKNNYNLKWIKENGEELEGIGVFNGDTGVIRKIDKEDEVIEVVFDDEKIVNYDFGILEEIELAYGITIHKSQGSEFPVVIMPLYPGPKVLMSRNLLYTAVTRARDMVVLVGCEDVLQDMVSNDSETLRFTGLAEKLVKYFI